MNLVEITIKAVDKASDGFKKAEIDSEKLKKAGLTAALAFGGSAATSVAGALGVAGIAVGAFGAVAGPELKKVEAAAQKTGKAGQKAWAQLTPAQQALGSTLKNVETQFGKLQEKLAPVVDRVITLAGKTVSDLLPALGKLATAGGNVLSAFLKPFDAFIKSATFGKLIDQIAKLAVEVGNVVGPALVSLIQVLLKLFVSLAPIGITILQNLLPAIVQLVANLTPIIDVLAKATAAVIQFLGAHKLLVPVLEAVLAVVVAFRVIPGIIEAMKIAWLAFQVAMEASPIILLLTAIGVTVFLLATHWKQVWHDIKNWFHDAVQFMKMIWDGVYAWLSAPIKMYINFWKVQWDIVKSVFHAAVDFVRSIWGGIEAILEAPVKAAEAVIMGIIHGIESAFNGVVSFAKGVGHVLGDVGSFLGLASGGIVGAAGGGVHGGLRLVGEHGPELVKLPTGSTVFSNSDTRHMMGQGSGGGQVVISFDFGNGSDELVKILRKAIRVKGGNVQTVLGHG